MFCSPARHSNKDELYEIEVEEALKRQENEGSGGDDENEIFHDATDFVTVMSSGSDVTQSRMEAGVSEEVMNHQEKSWTACMLCTLGLEQDQNYLLNMVLLSTKRFMYIGSVQM